MDIPDIEPPLSLSPPTEQGKLERLWERLRHDLHFASKTHKLIKAVKERNAEKIQKALDKGANINAKSDLASDNYRSPLHFACLDEEDDIVSLLLDRGADMNVKDSLGETPLHYARNAQVALKLIQKGADVERRDANGWTPLHTACFNGRIDVIEILLQKLANVNACDNDGCTPLHIICEREDEKRKEIALMLLHHNARINAVDKNGRIPLHYVCDSWKDDENFVKVLIEHGAEANRLDKKNLTPLDYARTNKHPLTVELLQRCGFNAE